MALTVFGLTGGIGSGKSTVASHFAKRGVPIVDADELAREVVRPGTPGLDAIVRAFGADVLTADGALDRRALAERVFADEAARKRLEAITHPRIAALARERFARLEAEGHTLACYVVPLLFERGLEDTLRPVVTVVASEDAQLERAAARDAVSREHVAARLRAQLPLEEKARRSDFVIDNSGSLASAFAQADRVLDAIRREHAG